MARVIPQRTAAELAQPKMSAEARVYRAFRHLPDEMVVIHGLATLAAEVEGKPRDGEADFVVIHPTGAVLVVEVKGGGVAYDPNDDVWSSLSDGGVRRRISDPFRQARDRKYDLKKKIVDVGRPPAAARKLVFGHAAFFPDVFDVTEINRPDIEEQVIGGTKEMTRLASWIDSAVTFWRAREPPNWSDVGELEAACGHALKVLASPFEVVPRLGARIAREAEQQRYWTEEQWVALLGMRHWKRLGVEGSAGTGKTLLALHRAQELAQEGRDTLLLCYNRPLADHLRAENKSFLATVAGGVTLHTTTFHGLSRKWSEKVLLETGRDVLAEARAAVPRASEDQVQLPLALALALEERRLAYDAVIVDEGQDFRDEHWLPITGLVNENGVLAVFFDPNQSLYRRGASFPIEHERVYRLTRNLRSTVHIHDSAYKFYRGPEVVPPELAGVPVETWAVPDLPGQARRLYGELMRLIRKEHVPPECIAVLVVDSVTKSAAYDQIDAAIGQRKASERPPVVYETHRLPGRIVVDTVARFKGLEGAAIILWLNGPVDIVRDRELFYVGLSRACSFMALLGRAEEIEAVLGTIS